MSFSYSRAFPQNVFGLNPNNQQTAQHIEDFEAQMAAARTLLPGDEDPNAPPPAYSRSVASDSAPAYSSAHPPAPVPSSSTSSTPGRASVPAATSPSSSLSQQQQQQEQEQAPPSSTTDAPQVDAGSPPQLQAGRAWSSESVATFNNICLKNAIANAFDYHQSRTVPPGWAVRLTFGFFDGLGGGSGGGGGGDGNGDGDGDGSFTVSLPGPYGSKKEAKAAAAERGLELLEQAIERRRASGRMVAGKRKKSVLGAREGSEDGEIRAGDGAGAGEEVDEVDEEVENWIGLLGEYCQAENKPRPLFQEFTLGANYSMECIMPAEPRSTTTGGDGSGNDNGDDESPKAFGGRTVLFNSKRAAKTNAAREAVRWLRRTGRMPMKGHPTKKKMKAAARAQQQQQQNSQQVLFANTGGAAQPFSNPVPVPIPMPVDGGASGGGTGSGSESEGSGSGGGGSGGSPGGLPGMRDRSLGEQVMILCSKLGCAQPIYKIAPDPRVPSMWSGAAYFPHDPAVTSASPGGRPVGEVRNVYGKKKAREEVARKVLKHLKALQAERQRFIEGVMGAGMAGPAGPA